MLRKANWMRSSSGTRPQGQAASDDVGPLRGDVEGAGGTAQAGWGAWLGLVWSRGGAERVAGTFFSRGTKSSRRGARVRRSSFVVRRAQRGRVARRSAESALARSGGWRDGSFRFVDIFVTTCDGEEKKADGH